jgi:hypothetical protein
VGHPKHNQCRHERDDECHDADQRETLLGPS